MPLRDHVGNEWIKSTFYDKWFIICEMNSPRSTPQMNRREFSTIISSLFVLPSWRELVQENCPVKTDSQNLLISRVPPGEKGKEAMTAPGKSRELAH